MSDGCQTDSNAHNSKWKTAAFVTVHCLIGCVIGEVLGLMIGVSLRLGVWPTMLLATFLAFVVGISLAGHSLMKREGIQFSKGVRIVLLGEVVSITVMEIAMNGVDYWIGGVQAMSLSEPIFWIGLLAAIPAGYIAALPINYWLISRNLKKCH